MRTIIAICLGFILALAPRPDLRAQPVPRDIRTPEYRQLQEKLASGWNTWYNKSVASEVSLPEGFSINLCFARPGSADYLKEVLMASEKAGRPEKVQLGLRSDDGRYTSMRLTYKGEDFTIETATDGKEELILVSAGMLSKSYLVAFRRSRSTTCKRQSTNPVLTIRRCMTAFLSMCIRIRCD